jgi:molybdopterin synthase sulfur carrier subunit
MSVKILFFAGLREAIGQSSELIQLPAGASSVGAIRDVLAARGEPWNALVTTKNLRYAVNQSMVAADAAVADGDEVAFFPPVTGG